MPNSNIIRDKQPAIAVARLCKLFGKTRHAFYDHGWRTQSQYLKDDLVLQIVNEVRKTLPEIGTRKLHYMVNQKLEAHELQVGRDHLFELLRAYKLLVRCRRRKVVTTNSGHWMKKYSNLIKELQVSRPEQLWVSDITHIPTASGPLYLFLITDAYSRKIIGFNLSKDLKTEGCLKSLTMALSSRTFPRKPLIHHSDRGSQYCCKEYMSLLQENDIAISMTKAGDPYENGIAERVNGVLKSEFNLYCTHWGKEQTWEFVQKSIAAYNQHRPHSSCDYLTPEQAHRESGVLKKRWKSYYRQSLLDN